MGWRRVSPRAALGWLALAVVVGLIVWLVRSTMPPGAKDWDVDAQGPVLVSADGRTLTLTGVPDPAWSPAGCFSGLNVDAKSAVRGTDVAIWFHLHDVPRQPGWPAGVCAQFRGIEIVLDSPLGTRDLTDSHGCPLRTVREAELPWPRQAGMIAEPDTLCLPDRISSQDCHGTPALLRAYDAQAAQPGQAGHAHWTLYQSLEPGPPDPHPSGQFAESARAIVNGVPVACRPSGQGGLEVDWLWAGPAQWLIVSPPADGVARTTAQWCGFAFDAARTVR